LDDADIYHSPVFAIPQEVRKSNVKQVFITSYDIIALLYPQYFEKDTIDMVKSIVNSITRDTWVLCISEATRNDLLNYLKDKIDPKKTVVTELAASENFYRSLNKDHNKQIRIKYNIPECPYILSLCTLEPRKNIESVIKGFVRIVQQENIPDLNLVLGGAKGWLFDKIFDELEASSTIKERIIVTGYLADDDLASVYSDALAFVYPSFYEGFGLPPLEAMQCGTPVITSNTSSLPEVVGDAGIMVEPTDLDALCQAMLTIYKNSSVREQMVQKSLERASKFSWERCAGETLKAYKTSLSAY
jgi:glycosyltransferase involved in cell wall biosynthesis